VRRPAGGDGGRRGGRGVVQPVGAERVRGRAVRRGGDAAVLRVAAGAAAVPLSVQARPGVPRLRQRPRRAERHPRLRPPHDEVLMPDREPAPSVAAGDRPPRAGYIEYTATYTTASPRQIHGQTDRHTCVTRLNKREL